jgi:hypothetical protein
MKIRLFTAVWGDKYIQFLKNGCVKSLLWPKNHAALKEDDVLWCIYCNAEERDAIRAIIEPLGVAYEFYPLQDGKDNQETQQLALTDEIAACIDNDAISFNVGPDLIYGDGSIKVILDLAKENSERCISLPTVRVNSVPFLELMSDVPLSNRQLLSLTMQNMHVSWKTCDASLPETNCWNGGTSWRRIADDMYAVTMRLPGVVAAKYTMEDFQYFKNNVGRTGVWDHFWPETLVSAERQRVIGSSDAAFIAELTVEKSHLPVLRKNLPNSQDIYKRTLLHNKVNANALIIWRV